MENFSAFLDKNKHEDSDNEQHDASLSGLRHTDHYSSK